MPDRRRFALLTAGIQRCAKGLDALAHPDQAAAAAEENRAIDGPSSTPTERRCGAWRAMPVSDSSTARTGASGRLRTLGRMALTS
jgi:hypothetical protein